MTLSLRNPLTLDELLNYRLLRLFSISGAPVIRLLEGRWGIARREWRLLALLATHGEMSPSALALRAHLDRPRTSRAITVLVAKRLAVRNSERGDARRASIALTAAGQRLYEEVFPQIAAINARVMEALDERTAQALDLALQQLTLQAERLNRELVQDVQANRSAGHAQRTSGEPGKRS